MKLTNHRLYFRISFAWVSALTIGIACSTGAKAYAFFQKFTHKELVSQATTTPNSVPSQQADVVSRRVDDSRSKLEQARRQLVAAKASVKAAEAEYKAARADQEAQALRSEARKLADSSQLPADAAQQNVTSNGSNGMVDLGSNSRLQGWDPTSQAASKSTAQDVQPIEAPIPMPAPAARQSEINSAEQQPQPLP